MHVICQMANILHCILGTMLFLLGLLTASCSAFLSIALRESDLLHPNSMTWIVLFAGLFVSWILCEFGRILINQLARPLLVAELSIFMISVAWYFASAVIPFLLPSG
jgi:hypothetical protein